MSLFDNRFASKNAAQARAWAMNSEERARDNSTSQRRHEPAAPKMGICDKCHKEALACGLLLGLDACPVHFEQVAHVVHEAQRTHREEADGIECEERSDDELLRTDVFEQTEDAVDAHAQFDNRLPGELLCVVAARRN